MHCTTSAFFERASPLLDPGGSFHGVHSLLFSWILKFTVFGDPKLKVASSPLLTFRRSACWRFLIGPQATDEGRAVADHNPRLPLSFFHRVPSPPVTATEGCSTPGSHPHAGAASDGALNSVGYTRSAPSTLDDRSDPRRGSHSRAVGLCLRLSSCSEDHDDHQSPEDDICSKGSGSGIGRGLDPRVKRNGSGSLSGSVLSPDLWPSSGLESAPGSRLRHEPEGPALVSGSGLSCGRQTGSGSGVGTVAGTDLAPFSGLKPEASLGCNNPELEGLYMWRPCAVKSREPSQVLVRWMDGDGGEVSELRKV